MSQQLDILRHLQQGNSITALEAMQEFRCMRLAAVVKDLRNQGHEIETDMVSNFEGKHYARYRIVSGQNF